MADKANLSKPSIVGPKNRTYFKRNYAKALEIITPDIYLEEDIDLSGVELNPISELINSHINIANNIAKIGFFVSAVSNSYPEIDKFNGISQFFVTQNALTNITPFNFDLKILKPLGVRWSTFSTSADFQTWVSDTLLPKITLSTEFLLDNTSSAFSNTASGTHKYLIENLSWFYFLNTSADGDLAFEPSSYVASAFAKTLYGGESLTLNDGLKGVSEYIWRNYSTCSTFSSLNLLPTTYVSSVESTSSTWTSGTQLLENLQTAIDIIYSPAAMNAQDSKVAEALYNFDSVGSYLSDTDPKGPFHKLLKILGYAISDYIDDSEKLSLICDIQACPDEYLPLLAELIGWHLFGHDSSRHRLQLQNAVEVYKRQGTKAGVQFALDSVFASGVYDINSKITELWESYLPNLIFYALVSESPLFTDLTTWTKEKAKELGIDSYSTSSVDENIRIVVDNIILNLISKHPDHFPLAGTTILDLIQTQDLSFYYRGRAFNAPPFEEYKYYKDAKVSDKLLETLRNILINSFCISEGAANGLIYYLKANTLNIQTTHFVDNQWLFFTSSITYPPNEFTMLGSLGNETSFKTLERRDKYLSLWNGKSSHVKIVVQAEDFDFNKVSLEGDSGQLLIQAGQILGAYVPAHTIVDFIADLSGAEFYEGNDAFLALWSKCDLDTFEAASGVGLSRYRDVGADMRALYPSPTFGRDVADGIICTNALPSERGISDALVSSTATTIQPRRALRRKNLVNFLDMCKYYDRGGYNMPLSFSTSTAEFSMASSVGFMPLGYIASAGKFQPVDISNLHNVWTTCENLQSGNTYFDVTTSNTFPCRGLLNVSSGKYNDRGQVLPIIGLMHKLIQQINYKTAEKIVLDSSAYFAPSAVWKDHITSYANSAVEALGWSPSSNWFHNFAWGRGINSLYHDYITHMGSHTTRPDAVDTEGGLDIISHAYGPLLFNSTLNADGSALASFPKLSASSLHGSSISALHYDDGSGVMSYFGGSDLGTSEVTNISALPVSAHVSGAAELRNAHIISGIELVVTSATPSKLNHFMVFKLDPVNVPQTVADTLINNRIIKMKAVDGFPRIRLDLHNYGLNSSKTSGNILMPEHNFTLNTKFLIAHETQPLLGGASLGVFIHTAVETSDNVIWVWTPQSKWLQVNAATLTKDDIINKYSHIKNVPLTEAEFDSSNILVPFEDCTLPNIFVPKQYEVDTFDDFELTFDTRNDRIVVDNNYFSSGTGLCASTVTGRQVHRSDQKYIIEIFMLPSLGNASIATILESVSMKDLTEFDKTKIKLPFSYSTSIAGCSAQAEVAVEKEDLLTILDHFKSMATGSLSRNSTITAATMDTSGGSKISYREHPTWGSTHVTTSGLYQIVEVEN